MLILERKPNPKPIKMVPLTIGDVINDLQSRGYKLKFRKEATCLFCIDLNWCITPDNFTVEEYYRFDDSTNPDRERIVYAISTTQGLFGFMIDASMAYEDNVSHHMQEKLGLNY